MMLQKKIKENGSGIFNVNYDSKIFKNKIKNGVKTPEHNPNLMISF